MNELVKHLQALLGQIKSAMDRLDIKGAKIRLANLQVEMASPNFWDDSEKAQQLSQEHSALEKRVNEWEGLKTAVAETLELAKLSDPKLETEIKSQLQELNQRYAQKEFELTLSGEYDRNNAILHIHAGTGGTDAMDWAQMLERMYLRWAEQNAYTSKLIERSTGEEAGVKSSLIEISGEYAYGKLRGEQGVHRLVRLSPFNADNLRQTSFALVEVLPKIDQPGQVELEDKDLKIDVFRSGGHGGQSVNTTDSAVRVTHIPTGIVVSIQNERSQLQNKETALAVLRSRLAKLAHEQHVQKLSELKGPSKSAEWGQQIRNYVLHPYKMVKDLRTQQETSDTEAVLDGDINPFIEAYLAKQIGKE